MSVANFTVVLTSKQKDRRIYPLETSATADVKIFPKIGDIFYLLVALDKSGDYQSKKGSPSGDHECMYHMS